MPAKRATKARPQNSYHHGDLRRALLDKATATIRDEGIEALNLRRLAADVGVSQTALYHHFRDKQALLGAVGEEGIRRFSAVLLQAFDVPDLPLRTRFERFASAYVRFAIANPELYELMLGRTTWRNSPADSFMTAARGTFRASAERIAALQASGEIASTLKPLRIAQLAWGMLHGLVRMHNDGLRFSAGDVEDIALYAAGLIDVLQRQAPSPRKPRPR